MALAKQLCINIESGNDVVEPSSCFYSEVLQHNGLIMETAQELLYAVLPVTPREKTPAKTNNSRCINIELKQQW